MPNLLVIMADQLRATALGMYGNQQTCQPHLERLAASGARFEHAFTPYPVCLPARVSFWTGRWPHLTGSRTNSIYMQSGETHLVQMLRERGYRTALIGKNHCFTDSQLQQYFDSHYPVDHAGPTDDQGDAGIAGAKQFRRTVGPPAYAASVSPYPAEKHSTWLIGNRADAFLRSNADQPWCMWVSFPDPHTPYRAPERYASLYAPESLALPPMEPPGYPGKPDRVRYFAELLGAHEVTDDHLRFLLSVYYGMIAAIDDVVGRLLDALEHTGQRENTIVVFTSDHGDYMTEHRLVRKGASLYESMVRVPLLVSYPRRVAAGTVSDDLVSMLDVFPTLVDFMDLPLPPGRSGQTLPRIAGGTPREIVFAETGIEGTFTTRQEVQNHLASLAAQGKQRPAPWQLITNGKLKMARTKQWKYVYAPGPHGEDELYDLAEDPYELRNLASDPAQRERIAWFQAQLLDWMIMSEDTLPVPAPRTARADRALGQPGQAVTEAGVRGEIAKADAAAREPSADVGQAIRETNDGGVGRPPEGRRVPAIVLTCDRYQPFAAHMIMRYEAVWPSHPFTFHVPYQQQPLQGGRVAERRTPEAIRATVLELIEDLEDDAWIYWCIDDKYPIQLVQPTVARLTEAIVSDGLPGVDGVIFCRWRKLLRPEHLLEERRDGPGGVVLLRRVNYAHIWIHQFLRVKVLRHLFLRFPESVPHPGAFDLMSLPLPADHRLYVVETNLAVFGESTIRGRITRNCAASLRALGLASPPGFEETDRELLIGTVDNGGRPWPALPADG